jgi:hypothetical protein
MMTPARSARRPVGSDGFYTAILGVGLSFYWTSYLFGDLPTIAVSCAIVVWSCAVLVFRENPEIASDI